MHTERTDNYVPMDIQVNSAEIQADIKLIPLPSTKMDLTTMEQDHLFPARPWP